MGDMLAGESTVVAGVSRGMGLAIARQHEAAPLTTDEV
jgi:NAD(P)-dependent dehydrogenase (short-subunit alcohol dehydrogenase family)